MAKNTGFAYAVQLNDPNDYGGANDAALVYDLQQALGIWSDYVAGLGTLVAQLDIGSTAEGRESGGPTSSAPAGTNAQGLQLYEPSSYYELTTGQHVSGTTSDITITIDTGYFSQLDLAPDLTYYSQVPDDQYNPIVVFLHELMHGLGQFGWYSQDGTLPGDYESTFDNLIQPSGSSASFTGAHAEAAYGGPVPLTTNSSAGENYYHFGNDQGDIDRTPATVQDPLTLDLMNGIVFYYDYQYQISKLDLGVLQDLGYSLLPPAHQSAAVLNDFGWAQGWGSPDNPRMLADVNGDGTSDYVGFGSQATFISYGGTFANGQNATGPGFSGAVVSVDDFGTAQGYTAAVQRGVAATGAGAGDSVYGQGYAGIYWYAASGSTTQNDAAGHGYKVLQYQATPNLYGNFGSRQGWSAQNGFQVLKSTASDAYASILGFGDGGIVVGPDAFAPGATAAGSYVIPFAAGNNSGWNQQNDIRTFIDAGGRTIDLNNDGVADFVGMGPQGLEFAFGNDSGPGGSYSLGPLTQAQIGPTDLGDDQGWTDSSTLRYVVADPGTGFDDILAFGAAGVEVAMGQNPTSHSGQAFGQLYLAMPDFGANQGWSVSQNPRLVGDVNGDGIPDIVGFGYSSTFVALGSKDAGGNLRFEIDPNLTIGDFGSSEGWSGANPQTLRAVAQVSGGAGSQADLVFSGAYNTQSWQFA